jgi:hypothetical protein
MQALIEKAPDDELVVSVMAGRPPAYDYIVSALKIVLRTKDLARFKISRQRAQKALRIEPQSRSDLVKAISKLLKDRGLFQPAFNSNTDGLFLTGDAVDFEARVRFGDGHVANYDEKTILSDLRRHGLYRRAGADGSAMRVGIVNGLKTGTTGAFVSQLRQNLAPLGFGLEVVGEAAADPGSRAEFERAVGKLELQKAHILAGIFANEIGEDEEDWGSYHEFKSLTVGRGIPSQVVYESTLGKPYAMANIVLGVMGKTGNVPYVRPAALPYADLVVGIDIARKKKERLSGSINATAITRIYFSNGECFRYAIHDAPLEGETIPENVVQGLFPMDEFKGKRVVDGVAGYSCILGIASAGLWCGMASRAVAKGACSHGDNRAASSTALSSMTFSSMMRREGKSESTLGPKANGSVTENALACICLRTRISFRAAANTRCCRWHATEATR